MLDKGELERSESIRSSVLRSSIFYETGKSVDLETRRTRVSTLTERGEVDDSTVSREFLARFTSHLEVG